MLLLLLNAETNHLKYNNLSFTLIKVIIYATQKQQLHDCLILNILSNYALAASTHNELIVTFGFVNIKRFIAFCVDRMSTQNELMN